MSCVLSFMIPGHTKFSPDRSFGMIKRKYRRTKVDSPTQLMYWVVTLLNLSPTTTGLNFYRLTSMFFLKSKSLHNISVFAILPYLYGSLLTWKRLSLNFLKQVTS